MTEVNVKERAAEREKRVLRRWEEERTFARSIERREGKPQFVFYDGPPTANGAPHIGHVLGRVLKDFICRYKTMTGHQVQRKAGWDTHGLPVELGVERELGISGKQEIEAYGVEAFVQKCKDSVFRYEKQWRDLTEAVGYWTDMNEPYITLSNEYIESVWHILSHIHRQGHLYKGHRVSPYCPSCQTTLSSHELAQGYEDVKDLSATVKFVNKQTGEIFLAWTTTPWTLPANTALAVNPELDYVRVRQNGQVFILAKSLLPQVMKEPYELLSEHKGREWIGTAYEPPYRFRPVAHGHVVIGADFVSDASGTGIVHIAPAHGEDDYRAAKEHGISMLQVVGPDGRYTGDVAPFAGRFVKDCDVDIIKDLAGRGLLFAKEKIEHSYPFCWRCKTPLLYYAMDSWFIRTTAVKEQLIQNNAAVDWYPGHVREGRFGKFLEELVDWNISRNRYWGTPLNVWECGSCGHTLAPGGIAELREHAAAPLPEPLDLHKPYADEIRLRCPACEGLMNRTPEVIDVWFDSGSMPFAQHHYPFENRDRFGDQFPADMICEGIDQTRGWFYSLLAVSTLYTGRSPYKAVMATGHILDEHGQKMSKSKGNVIDPWEIIEAYGADAFRWALLSDSAPWVSKRFSRSIVAEAKSKVMDTLLNAFAFYTMYAAIDGWDAAAEGDTEVSAEDGHPLDRWIRSRLERTVTAVGTALEAYDMVKAAQGIETLIDDFSNWYIRRSRERFWGSGLSGDKRAAYSTMRKVLLTVSQLMAPFAPFLSDELYRSLSGGESVHLTDFPSADDSRIDESLEADMALVRQAVELARSVRNDTGLKTRQPLSELVVVSEQADRLQAYAEIIRDEVNVKSVCLEGADSDLTEYRLKLNLRTAGPKYGKLTAAMQNALKELDQPSLKRIVERGTWDFAAPDGTNLEIPLSELLVESQAAAGYASASAGGMTVALNTAVTPELAKEGFIREVIRCVQDLRKQLQLPIEKRIHLTVDGEEEVRSWLGEYRTLLEQNVLLHTLTIGREEAMEEAAIGDKMIYFSVK